MDFAILAIVALAILAIAILAIFLRRKKANKSTPEVVYKTDEEQADSFYVRLQSTRESFKGGLSAIRERGVVDDRTWDLLEEVFLRADVGVVVTAEIIKQLQSNGENKKSVEVLLANLKSLILARLSTIDRSLSFFGDSKPTTSLFVGVNGVGKTTTIGKVALRYTEAGYKVLVAAGDTFRAAAAEQLEIWAQRSKADFVRGNEGGDPSAVIFDGISKAKAKDITMVLADTAGRLHNKTNLIEELKKIRRIVTRESGSVGEVLLVLDATTGQNGLTQAKVFTEAIQCTGVVLTKLDGSAKGGVALAIELELGLPIKLVGVGESNKDLIDFDPKAFVESIFEDTSFTKVVARQQAM